ncbi:unnamed protein product [Ostreobium quekettii]|uniref:Chalcone isomerase domain-containing protein n=1 Tax=Ostreobium quekettii TaxID=121088 RepID=A0A8S1JD05_9CHLO|nr:unnamed protein product [Ostreobium quekettii]
MAPPLHTAAPAASTTVASTSRAFCQARGRLIKLRWNGETRQGTALKPGRLHGASVWAIHPRQLRCRRFACTASLTIKERQTGVEFKLVQKFWDGGICRNLGAAARTKKVALFTVKVYAVALYVEAERAAKELRIRSKGGFGEGDEDYCAALIDGVFQKALQLTMVRDVSSDQFVEAIDDALRPSMQFRGEVGPLEDFQAYMLSQRLDKGVNVLLLWSTDSYLDVAVLPPSTSAFEKVTPGKRIESTSLARGLFEIYLGDSSIVPTAKKEWAEGARRLVASIEE